MPKKTVKVEGAGGSDDDEDGGPMPDWKRKKNLAEIQKLKVFNMHVS